MKADQLLDGIDVVDLANLFPDMELTGVTCDSREVCPGMVFVAIPGTHLDGHKYISNALSAGATLVVQSQPLEPAAVGSFVRVADPRAVFAELAARFAGHPSRALRVIGVTGTNGKTSTVLIIRHLLNSVGYKAAALGTLGLLKPGAEAYERRGLTTPDAGNLQKMMRELVDEGATHLVMEVSSHALAQGRVNAVEFTGGVFTNLTQDHFDYHGTVEEYGEAKARLFTRHLAMSGGYAVINGNDEFGQKLSVRFSGISVIYGSERKHNLVCQDVVAGAGKLEWDTVLKNGVWPSNLDLNVNHARMSVGLTGWYNVENSLAAIGVALLEGLSLRDIVAGLETFPGVPGRLEKVDNPRGINVFVDYAHTPDAVESTLKALNAVREEGSRMITVVGCGGDRDRDKRPLMGAAAQRSSDVVVITSDNPRSEDPEAIIDEIFKGIDPQGSETRRISDRREAIHEALRTAGPGDFVLIAGKGHEDYQIIGEETIHFSDREEVLAYFSR